MRNHFCRTPDCGPPCSFYCTNNACSNYTRLASKEMLQTLPGCHYSFQLDPCPAPSLPSSLDLTAYQLPAKPSIVFELP